MMHKVKILDAFDPGELEAKINESISEEERNFGQILDIKYQVSPYADVSQERTKTIYSALIIFSQR